MENPNILSSNLNQAKVRAYDIQSMIMNLQVQARETADLIGSLTQRIAKLQKSADSETPVRSPEEDAKGLGGSSGPKSVVQVKSKKK